MKKMLRATQKNKQSQLFICRHLDYWTLEIQSLRAFKSAMEFCYMRHYIFNILGLRSISQRLDSVRHMSYQSECVFFDGHLEMCPEVVVCNR